MAASPETPPPGRGRAPRFAEHRRESPGGTLQPQIGGIRGNGALQAKPLSASASPSAQQGPGELFGKVGAPQSPREVDIEAATHNHLCSLLGEPAHIGHLLFSPNSQPGLKFTPPCWPPGPASARGLAPAQAWGQLSPELPQQKPRLSRNHQAASKLRARVGRDPAGAHGSQEAPRQHGRQQLARWGAARGRSFADPGLEGGTRVPVTTFPPGPSRSPRGAALTGRDCLDGDRPSPATGLLTAGHLYPTPGLPQSSTAHPGPPFKPTR